MTTRSTSLIKLNSHQAIYQFSAAILVFALCAMTLLSLSQPTLLSLTPSVGLDAAISTASLVIALGASYFALGEFLLYGVLSSLCVGVAFLIFAVGDGTLGLVPLFANWKHQTDWVIYGGSFERILGAAFLLAAALLVSRHASVSRRLRVVVLGLLGVFAGGVLVAVWVYLTPSTAVSQPIQSSLQIVGAMFFFAAGVLFWRAARPEDVTWFYWLAYSLTIAGFAQIQYAIHQYPIGVVQPGDVLRVVFFTGILLALAAQLSQDYRRLRWQARELEALHALMTAPTVDNAAAVVQHIVQTVSVTLEAQARVLIAERRDHYANDPLAAQMMRINGRSPTAKSPGRSPIVLGFDEGPQGHVALGVPLMTTNRQLGMLVAMRAAGDEFSIHDVRLLRAFGAQGSLLLERSLLYEEVAAGAVMQERQRLAREIHDGLAQHLATLKMRVAWLQRSPETLGAGELKGIENVLETALIEARHAISTLRAEPEGTSTVDAISAYAEEFGQVSGIEVSLRLEQELHEVGPKTRVELLRVIQEALNNVRKHARASAVSVTVESLGSGTIVSVQDNGTGFETGQTLDGHFGLQIMAERAESVGGRLDVQSSRRGGTEIRIWVPTRESEEETESATWLPGIDH